MIPLIRITADGIRIFQGLGYFRLDLVLSTDIINMLCNLGLECILQTPTIITKSNKKAMFQRMEDRISNRRLCSQWEESPLILQYWSMKQQLSGVLYSPKDIIQVQPSEL